MTKDELDLVAGVERLRDGARQALSSSETLIDNHIAFAEGMELLFARTAEHRTGNISQLREVIEIRDSILVHSGELSTYAKTMREELKAVVTLVDAVRMARGKKEKKRKMWGFLVKVFTILSAACMVMGAVAPIVFPAIGVVGSVVLLPAGVIAGALAKVCREIQGSKSRKVSDARV